MFVDRVELAEVGQQKHVANLAKLTKLANLIGAKPLRAAPKQRGVTRVERVRWFSPFAVAARRFLEAARD